MIIILKYFDIPRQPTNTPHCFDREGDILPVTSVSINYLTIPDENRYHSVFSLNGILQESKKHKFVDPSWL